MPSAALSHFTYFSPAAIHIRPLREREGWKTRLLFQRSGQIKIYAPHHKAWQVLFGKNVNPYRESPFVLGRKTADTESN